MRPQGDYILKTLAQGLVTNYVPKMTSDNDKAGMALMAFMMLAVSEEFDRAAHRRVEENLELRKLFSRALPTVEDETLKSDLAAAAVEMETDWRISSLDKSNNALIELLIELHAHIESVENENARILKKEIWEVLKRYAKRREFKVWELSQAMLLEARKDPG
jgi:hypothetical protein